MSTTKQYVENLFRGSGISVSTSQSVLFEEFVSSERCDLDVVEIIKLQSRIMQNWQSRARIQDIKDQPIFIPNGTVGKEYRYEIDAEKLGWVDIKVAGFENLSEVGLEFDPESLVISGTPRKSGDLKIDMIFQMVAEDRDDVIHRKSISLIINADPKSLWKSIPSDKGAAFWKEDDVSASHAIGDRHIVVSSKRGRSHANVGSFRDDDFAFKYFPENGWSVVAVSDGAGSAKMSREGSRIACAEVLNYFEADLKLEEWSELEAVVRRFDELKKASVSTGQSEANQVANIEGGNDSGKTISMESLQTTISKTVYTHLGNCAKSINQKINVFASGLSASGSSFNCTLVFTLFKKFEFGYVILSFGVGDSPAAILTRDVEGVHLMNWLDVGEFSGGTRFFNYPEIFTSEKFPTRFGFRIIEDFSFLMLMTDGIYDPKFVVEVNLEKPEKWKEFVNDLQGMNADGAKVDFNPTNLNLAEQLSTWMDFWSPGNHDDRTLAIIF